MQNDYRRKETTAQCSHSNALDWIIPTNEENPTDPTKFGCASQSAGPRHPSLRPPLPRIFSCVSGHWNPQAGWAALARARLSRPERTPRVALSRTCHANAAEAVDVHGADVVAGYIVCELILAAMSREQSGWCARQLWLGTESKAEGVRGGHRVRL
jgi:hypothetical protein